MIATAITDYQVACNRARLDRRPVVYAAHYGDRPLGDISIPNAPDDTYLGRAVYGVMAPFACCDRVTDTVVIIDAQAPPGEPRTIFLCHLAHDGTNISMTHWRAPYGLSDTGETVVGEPEPGIVSPTSALAAISTIASQRLSHPSSYDYDEAVKAAVVFLNLLAQGKLRAR